jgi:hypothetical protein
VAIFDPRGVYVIKIVKIFLPIVQEFYCLSSTFLPKPRLEEVAFSEQLYHINLITQKKVFKFNIDYRTKNNEYRNSTFIIQFINKNLSILQH